MYEHLRAQLQERIAAQQAALSQRRSEQEVAQAATNAATAALTSAAGAADTARLALGTAEQALVAAQNELRRRRVQLDNAQQAVDVSAGDEPDKLVPNNKPNPEWAKWSRAHGKLVAARVKAKTALDTAQIAVSTAVETRDLAGQTLAEAERMVELRRTDLTAAEAAFAIADSAVSAAEDAAEALAAEGRSLDAQQARILAEPLDADDVSAAADAELAAAAPRRRQRRALRQHRFEVTLERAATLGLHDDKVDDLAVFAATMRSWPNAGSFPDLANIAAEIDALVAAARADQSLPPAQRTEGVNALAVRLTALRERLQVIVTGASADRDGRVADLAQAASDLRAVNEQAPTA